MFCPQSQHGSCLDSTATNANLWADDNYRQMACGARTAGLCLSIMPWVMVRQLCVCMQCSGWRLHELVIGGIPQQLVCYICP